MDAFTQPSVRVCVRVCVRACVCACVCVLFVRVCGILCCDMLRQMDFTVTHDSKRIKRTRGDPIENRKYALWRKVSWCKETWGGESSPSEDSPSLLVAQRGLAGRVGGSPQKALDKYSPFTIQETPKGMTRRRLHSLPFKRTDQSEVWLVSLKGNIALLRNILHYSLALLKHSYIVSVSIE